MLALARSVNERKEPDALGIFVEITSPSNVFAGVQPWSLALQKSGESLVLADIPVYLDKSVFFWKSWSLKVNNHSSQNQISTSCLIYPEAMAPLPPNTCTQTNHKLFDWEQFETNGCMPFLMHLRKKLRQCFHSLISGWHSTNQTQKHCWKSLICLMNLVWMSLANSSVIIVMTNLVFTMLMNRTKKLIWTP